MFTAIVAGLCAAVTAPGGTPVQANVLRQPALSEAVALVSEDQPEMAQGYELSRASDGFFYVDAYVNGVSIRFLIDTGASVVVLRAEDAARAGLAPEAGHYSVNAETANGQASVARVTLDEVVVGHVHSRAINAAVVRNGPSVSLLGQNWLSKLGSVTIAGNRMTLR